MYINDRAYLTPLDNDAISVLKCSFCEEDIYKGEDYYSFKVFNCCEKCLDIYFKFTVEMPDLEAEKADLEYYDFR